MGSKKEYKITMSTQPSKVKLSDEELVALKQKCVSLYIDAVIMKNSMEIGE